MDAFRIKMKTTIMNSTSAIAEADETSGAAPSAAPPTVNPHFEVRVGKRRWLDGKKKGASKVGGDDSDGESR